jgi:hypothetical protein
MERTDKDINLHRISLRRQFFVEENIMETLQLKAGFSYSPSGHPDARV